MKCSPIRQIYYNQGNGYTVAAYTTDEPLPPKVLGKKNGQYGMFQAVGTELPTDEGLEVELTGNWKEGKYGYQYQVTSFQVEIPSTI